MPSTPSTVTATERLRARANEVAERLEAERERERTVREALERQSNTREKEITQRHELDHEHDPGLEL